MTTRDFRVRGWVGSLLILWVLIGAGGAIYATVALTHPGYGEGLIIPPTIEWPGEPGFINAAGVIAEWLWGLLLVPVLVTGVVRLRGWRRRNWLLGGAWVASWAAGIVLMNQAADWTIAGLGVNHRVVSIGEIALGVAWLVLGAFMTWILAISNDRGADLRKDRPRGHAKSALS